MRDTIIEAMGKYSTHKNKDYVRSCTLTQIVQLYSAVEAMMPNANANVVSFMPWLTAVTGCNTAMYHLGSETQSNASMLYIAPYAGKNKAPLERCLRTLYSVISNQDKLQSVLDKEEAMKSSTRLKRVFGRTLNQLSLLDERSDSQNALALLGNGSSYDTDLYKYMNNSSLVVFSRHYMEPKTIMERPGGENLDELKTHYEDIIDCRSDGESSSDSGTEASADTDNKDANKNEPDYNEESLNDGSRFEDEPDLGSLLGDAKDANATCQPGGREDLSQGMAAGGIRTSVGTENNQDEVLRPCEPTGAEDSQVECLM